MHSKACMKLEPIYFTNSTTLHDIPALAESTRQMQSLRVIENKECRYPQSYIQVSTLYLSLVDSTWFKIR